MSPNIFFEFQQAQIAVRIQVRFELVRMNEFLRAADNGALALVAGMNPHVRLQVEVQREGL